MSFYVSYVFLFLFLPRAFKNFSIKNMLIRGTGVSVDEEKGGRFLYWDSIRLGSLISRAPV